MYLKSILVVIVTLIIPTSLIAQQNYLSKEYIYKSYDWDAFNEEIILTPEDSSESAVILLDRTILEFSDSKWNQEVSGVVSRHFKVLINTEEGLQNLNKVYIPIKVGSNIIQLKARSIDPNGVITDFDKKNLKDISNVEEYGSFKIFAIEGAVIGSTIEYYYTIPAQLQYTFVEFAQGKYPVKHFSYYLKTSKNLDFAVYSNNGLNAAKFEKNDDRKLHTVQHSDIPAIKEESYSAYRSNRMNLNISIKKYFRNEFKGWSFVRDRYKYMVENIGIRSSGGLKEYMETYTNPRYQTKVEQLIQLENVIKKDINLVDGSADDLSDVRIILKNKNANELGMVRIFAEVLSKLKFDYQLLTTSNRFQNRFSSLKPSLASATEFLLYIPEIDAYLSPSDFRYRLGMAPYYLADNDALVVNSEKYDKFHYIKNNEMDKNLIKSEIEIDFKDGIEQPKLKKRNEWYGHRGSFLRWSYANTPIENKEDMLESLSISGTNGASLIGNEVENYKYNFFDAENTPFILNAELDVSSLIERAGNDYIFNIGQVIGSQTELYQETERTNPVDLDYPIKYIHNISFNTPEGYVVEGLNDVVRNHKIVGNDSLIVGEYDAYFETKGDTVTITMTEYYTKSHFTIEQYEAFRTLINSAADFNKLSLVLLKE